MSLLRKVLVLQEERMELLGKFCAINSLITQDFSFLWYSLEFHKQDDSMKHIEQKMLQNSLSLLRCFYCLFFLVQSILHVTKCKNGQNIFT